jgi:hypothetical protein
MPVHDDLEKDLPRLAALLERGGREPFLTHPIVLPEPEWFPDDWTPDLESVRDLALRLLAYAGLPELDAECGLLFADREPQWLPEVLRATARREQGVAGQFLGIEDGCAYFAIEADELERPDDVGGVLAHEVAHAWRHVRGLDAPPAPDEEELTDLTTIVLGFGLVTANHAYRYRTSTDPAGLFAGTTASHRTAGYLGAERLAALLAVQCLVRGEDPGDYRPYLETTQRAAFDEVCRASDPEELCAQLGIDDDALDLPIESEPAEVMPRPSRVARLVERDAERILSHVGAQGGILDDGLPLDYEPIEGRRHPLGAWGRPHREGGWMRELDLLEAPVRECSLLVLTTRRGTDVACRALGVVADETARRSSALAKALGPWFERAVLETLCAGEVPSFVRGHGDGLLDVDDLGRLLTAALARLDGPALAAEVAWLARDDVRSWERVEQEAEGAPRPPAKSPDPRAALRAWWQHVSRPVIVEDELDTWDVLADPADSASEDEIAAMQDLRAFAESYTAAWCSGDPARVAGHFATDGALTINGGDPARGREAIAESAAAFMSAFPDLVVILDELEPAPEGAIYRWTLTGTHGETGRRVRISGHKEWRLGVDGRIADSSGHFDADEYERQVAEAVREDA